jgi:O-antigen ligase
MVGIAAGLLAGAQPLYLGLALGAVITVVYFFADFERAVLNLLILRSSLDIFSAQQLPAVYAIGIDALTLLYVTVLLLTGRTVRTDWFWWFFAGWVMLQSLWLILSALGGLGLDASALPGGIREWTRLFSLLMIYLLVMQLKDKVHPEKIISWLFISLIPPIIAAFIQILLPASMLPPQLALEGLEEGRIFGTLGHASTFAHYLLLFIGLTCWKLRQAQRRWPWLLLLGLLTFVYVSTHSLLALVMLCVFVLALIVPNLNLGNAIGGILLLVLVVGLFASSDLGRERLDMLAGTPLLNPNIDTSRAILLSNSDVNSFNWRLAQWSYMLQSWQKSPLFGSGLATTIYLSPFNNMAHNDYIRALAEGGIVGLVTFLAFLGAQSVRLVQLFRNTVDGSAKHDLCLVLLAFFLAMLVGMLTDNVWYSTTLLFYWWIIFGVAAWNWKVQPSESL